MPDRHTDALLSKYPIISDQIKRPALKVVLEQLESTIEKQISGDVVEFGCYIGTTSLFLRRMLDAHDQSGSKQLHVYDSFAGLPAKTSQDASAAGEQFVSGELAVSKKQLLEQFHRANLRPPMVHKCWFNELTDHDVPEVISFAFLDGDFYTSIHDSLRLVWPKLSAGGIITIDDYKREALPGPERAVQEFFKDKAIKPVAYAHNIAIICKL